MNPIATVPKNKTIPMIAIHIKPLKANPTITTISQATRKATRRTSTPTSKGSDSRQLLTLRHSAERELPHLCVYPLIVADLTGQIRKRDKVGLYGQTSPAHRDRALVARLACAVFIPSPWLLEAGGHSALVGA